MGADFYHCRLKAISRGDHKAVVASAAYRAGMALQDEKYGTVRDFSRKSDVVATFTVAPEGAPEWASNITQLWNRVEAHERRKDSILSYEWEVALPNELAPAEREAIARSFAGWLAEQYGVGVTVGIHEGGNRGNGLNDHMHVMMTARGIDEDGFEARKYNCFNVRPGTPNPEVENVRKHVGDLINEALEDAGSDTRVDHRSFKERGIDREPTRHLGPAATAYERQGYETERGDINRDIIEERLRWQLEQAPLEITAAAEQELAGRWGDAVAHDMAEARRGRPLGDNITEGATAGHSPLSQNVAEIRAGHHPEPSWWRRAWQGAREAAAAYWHDESSGTPEGERGFLSRLFGGLGTVERGHGHHDAAELAEGLAETGSVLRDGLRELTADEAGAVPAPEAPGTQAKSWRQKVAEELRHLNRLVHDQRGAGPGIGSPEPGEEPQGGQPMTMRQMLDAMLRGELDAAGSADDMQAEEWMQGHGGQWNDDQPGVTDAGGCEPLPEPGAEPEGPDYEPDM